MATGDAKVYTRVQCPRDVMEKWWHSTWSEIIHAAETREDCLEVVHLKAGERCPTNFALFRQGVGEMFDYGDWGKNRTLLFYQGW